MVAEPLPVSGCATSTDQAELLTTLLSPLIIIAAGAHVKPQLSPGSLSRSANLPGLRFPRHQTL
jgi:hypothetical protein